MQKQLSGAELPGLEGVSLWEVFHLEDRVDIRVTGPAGPQLDVTMGCQLPVPGSPSHPSFNLCPSGQAELLPALPHPPGRVWTRQSCYEVSRGQKTPGKRVPALFAPALPIPPCCCGLLAAGKGWQHPCRIHPSAGCSACLLFQLP